VKEARLDETLRCRLLPEPAGADRCSVEVVRDAPMNIVSGHSFKDIVTFDTQRGLPEKIVSQERWGKGSREGVIKLDEIKTHDVDWARRIGADAEHYFAAQQAYQKATDGRHKTAADLTAALDKAVAHLKATRAELQLPEFQKQVDEMISRHDQTAKWPLEKAKMWEEVLNKPAAEWDTIDFDGKAHALKDYRGKVVILDFWFRGCGWCIRAMPQMKQIAEHFKDKPVVVVGMNTDNKEEDAKFIIEKMGLNYRNLKATGLPEKYKVRGFPTLLILDRQGIVRDIHVGYSPTLKDDVVRSVERLLQAKP
jgi:thiol-disulfide isomerase/thioredoxin